jgi:hypothetical protein
MDHKALKRIASRKLRKKLLQDLVGEGNHYRRFWCSWLICDERSWWPWAKALQRAIWRSGKPLSEEETAAERNLWERYNRRK